MPTTDEIQTAMERRRSSSVSTFSSVDSGSDGEKKRYLQLVPESEEV